jgi:hypothetical protein
LRQRKLALVIESDLNRLALRIDLQNLRAAATPLENVAAAARRIRRWLLPLAPLAGLLAARIVRKRSGVLGKLVSLVRWVSLGLAVWRQFSAAGEKSPNAEAG